ncbi:MAG: ABC transporter permease [Oscillospiraceae bacterium]|nr:ABC transporter permease [Oscillospiraceae bacterium]
MLFKKECKKILFSVTFLLFLFGISGFFFSQFMGDTGEAEEAPMKGLDDYGMIVKEDPDILMPAAVKALLNNYSVNTYTAYPVGFYKQVKLRDRKKDEMTDILTELTGLTRDELEKYTAPVTNSGTVNENGEFVPAAASENDTDDISVSSTLTYDRFNELMNKADKIIGGGSDYSTQNLINTFSLIPATYEDKLAEYNSLTDNDNIFTSYSRLFCDYIGIPLSILPVFICTAFCLKDKKNQMQQLIYTRKISSSRLIITRYLSVIAMTLIPAAVSMILAAIHISDLYPGNASHILTFFVLPAVWLIPAITFSSALAMLITEATSSMLAVLIQGVMWFVSLSSSIGNLTGSTKLFTFIIRHNSVYDDAAFTNTLSTFYLNRIIYFLLSAALIIACAQIYELKRRGKFYEFKGFAVHNKNKSEA